MVRSLLKSWPSLEFQLQLEQQLFGANSNLLRDWFEVQLSWINDAQFARQFSDNISLPNIVPSDYNHRHVRTRFGSLLAGVRFFGRDVTRPFVEITAHSFTDMERLGTVVDDEWRAFAPPFMRLAVSKGTLPTVSSFLDVTIHAARFCEMSDPATSVKLVPVANLNDALEMVQKRYKVLRDKRHELALNTSPASMEDLKDCADASKLFWIKNDDTAAVGLFATQPGQIDWIEGDVVYEEVTQAKFSGQGFAVSAQGRYAKARLETEPDRFLIGTIDRHNHTSRKSAVRAGRPEVMRKVFVPLG